MEVRVLCLDGVPTDEMRYRQVVATLVYVALCLQAIEADELVLEESGDGHTKGELPLRWLLTDIEGL